MAKMSSPTLPQGNVNWVIMLTLVLVSILSIVSSESEMSRGFSQHHLKRLTPLDLYPRNYYQLFHDMESWKRAPSAGFYGMRGKKVPSSNFYGMRGKKGPSGFLGMRGKKMDAYSQLDTSNELFSPTDSFENIWSPKSPGFLERASSDPEMAAVADDLLAENNGRQDERTERLLGKTNLGKINI